MLLEERHRPVVEQIRRSDRRLAIIELGPSYCRHRTYPGRRNAPSPAVAVRLGKLFGGRRRLALAVFEFECDGTMVHLHGQNSAAV